MAENPLGLKPHKQSQATEAPEMRNTEFETLLSQAIAGNLRVILRYNNGLNERTFEPCALFYTTKDRSQVNVSGTQVRDSAKPTGPSVPQIFEVAKISRLTLTGKTFKPDPRFNRFDKTYANGIICCAKV